LERDVEEHERQEQPPDIADDHRDGCSDDRADEDESGRLARIRRRIPRHQTRAASDQRRKQKMGGRPVARDEGSSWGSVCHGVARPSSGRWAHHTRAREPAGARDGLGGAWRAGPASTSEAAYTHGLMGLSARTVGGR
jgi:hypothetical protein